MRCAPRSHLHSYLTRRPSTQSIPNPNTRSATTPANRSIAKCNSTDPHRVDDDGDWEPLGYPYERRYGVYHQSTTQYCGAYAAKHYSICYGAYAPMHDSIRCGVSHQSCGMLRCLLLALKPMSYGGVYYFSAEVLRPEVSLTAPKDAEVVTITEAGLLKSQKRRHLGISKVYSRRVTLYASTLKKRYITFERSGCQSSNWWGDRHQSRSM